MSASRRNKRIGIQRRRAQTDGRGHPDKNVKWLTLFTRYAAIYYGTGGEARAAAQEQATQSASFEVLSDSDTREIGAGDRIEYPVGSKIYWDIKAIAEAGFNKEIRFTATKGVRA
jgi:head-tail adaptor